MGILSCIELYLAEILILIIWCLAALMSILVAVQIYRLLSARNLMILVLHFQLLGCKAFITADLQPNLTLVLSHALRSVEVGPFCAVQGPQNGREFLGMSVDRRTPEYKVCYAPKFLNGTMISILSTEDHTKGYILETITKCEKGSFRDVQFQGCTPVPKSDKTEKCVTQVNYNRISRINYCKIPGPHSQCLSGIYKRSYLCKTHYPHHVYGTLSVGHTATRLRRSPTLILALASFTGGLIGGFTQSYLFGGHTDHDLIEVLQKDIKLINSDFKQLKADVNALTMSNIQLQELIETIMGDFCTNGSHILKGDMNIQVTSLFSDSTESHKFCTKDTFKHIADSIINDKQILTHKILELPDIQLSLRKQGINQMLIVFQETNSWCVLLLLIVLYILLKIGLFYFTTPKQHYHVYDTMHDRFLCTGRHHIGEDFQCKCGLFVGDRKLFQIVPECVSSLNVRNPLRSYMVPLNIATALGAPAIVEMESAPDAVNETLPMTEHHSDPPL